MGTGFIDYHRSDAVRILDFAHAAGKVAESGRVVFGEDTPEFKDWFRKQRATKELIDDLEQQTPAWRPVHSTNSES